MKANSQIRQNLLTFLNYRQESKSDFYKKSNLSNGFIDKLGDRLSIKSQSKISKAYPELNINWLLTGEGTMIKQEYLASKPISSQVKEKKQVNNSELDLLYFTIEILKENLQRKDSQIESLFDVIRSLTPKTFRD